MKPLKILSGDAFENLKSEDIYKYDKLELFFDLEEFLGNSMN